MSRLGYAAMCEQFSPSDLLAWSRQAEQAGFDAVMASDHYQPWTPEQGQSAFVWSLLGAIGATTGLRFGTGVTAPGFRYHPAIIAQAAGTLGAMFSGRFWLGIGAGEALNEHVVHKYWPEAPARLKILMEAIDVIQKLFAGQSTRYDGEFIKMETVTLYTRPEQPPPIYIATSGPVMSERTGRLTDGIITVGAADEKIKMLMDRFEKGARAAGKNPARMPRLIQLHVSWAESDQEAVAQAVREWPNGGMNFPKADIRHPEDFAAMAKLVRPENFAGRVFMSADLEQHQTHIQHYIDMGFTEVYVHNVGRNQEAFIRAYGEQVIPKLKWPG